VYEVLCFMSHHVLMLILVLFRIDANVEDAELNVEAAHNEIVKYFQSITSNRWLMIKIFAVLIFFFFFFVIFMA
jgi:syntaxin 5